MSAPPLSGQVILVTGGGRGIGRATAEVLRRRGAVPVLADVDAEALSEAAARLGGDVQTIELDVTDADACERAVAEILERHGKLDVVWANAGIATFGPLAQTDPGAWVKTIEINLVGAYRTIRAALPAVIAARGYVAVTASLASFVHAPGMSAYSASKAGVEAMCNSLRIELDPHGVEVATIHPSWIATPMVNEGDVELRAFGRLREAMRGPASKTHPVEKVAVAIADGFERRASRICFPGWARAVHVFRSAMRTRVAERDQREAAADIERLFAEEVAARGADAASMSARVHDKVIEPAESR
jgi:NAD(P)-dependent dehydrogenase (short-subunit alcohol dehydrogenase family)